MNPELLPEDWRKVIAPEFAKPYWGNLVKFLAEQRAEKTVFPPEEEVFTAFWATPYDQVRVVLFGQDPYHGPGQAHGMSFSVKPGVPTPPSLVNMFKELKSDLGFDAPDHGNLTPWARQGMLLLNAVLTVRQAEPNSHASQGWEQLTDAVITALNARSIPVVFLLWGSYAKKKAKLIKGKHHKIIEGTHPSPLSAHMGFFGSKPYSGINKELTALGHAPIEWALPRKAELGTAWKIGPGQPAQAAPAAPVAPRKHPLLEKLEVATGPAPEALKGLLDAGTYARMDESARLLIAKKLAELLPQSFQPAGLVGGVPAFTAGPEKSLFTVVSGQTIGKSVVDPFLLETTAVVSQAQLVAATPPGDWQISEYERLIASLSAQGLSLPTQAEWSASSRGGKVAILADQTYDISLPADLPIHRVRRLFGRG